MLIPSRKRRSAISKQTGALLDKLQAPVKHEKFKASRSDPMLLSISFTICTVGTRRRSHDISRRWSHQSGGGRETRISQWRVISGDLWGSVTRILVECRLPDAGRRRRKISNELENDPCPHVSERGVCSIVDVPGELMHESATAIGSLSWFPINCEENVGVIWDRRILCWIWRQMLLPLNWVFPWLTSERKQRRRRSEVLTLWNRGNTFHRRNCNVPKNRHMTAIVCHKAVNSYGMHFASCLCVFTSFRNAIKKWCFKDSCAHLWYTDNHCFQNKIQFVAEFTTTSDIVFL